MTGKTDFTPEEWELVLRGPSTAGMIVVTAGRGGTIRETYAIAKAYVEAREQHGDVVANHGASRVGPDLTHGDVPFERRGDGLHHQAAPWENRLTTGGRFCDSLSRH